MIDYVLVVLAAAPTKFLQSSIFYNLKQIIKRQEVVKNQTT